MNMQCAGNFVPLEQAVSFRADRAVLKGRLFSPANPPKAAVVLHGATGVPHAYYVKFARWLAEENRIAVLIYDYRDFGASATGPMRNSRATMVDWGLRDQPAAQTYLERLFPGVPVWVIGHSIGGMMIPFHPGASRIDRLITVASGPVNISDHPWPYQAMARLFWYGPLPIVSRLAGFLPAGRLGIGEDLPLGVYQQWRRWCISQGGYLGDVGRVLPLPDWRAVTAPTKIVAVADDDIVPPSTAWRLMQAYPEAKKRQLVVKPEKYDLPSIGHVGVFASRNAVVWPDLIA